MLTKKVVATPEFTFPLLASSAKSSPAPERPVKRERKYSTIDESGPKDRSAEKDAAKGLEPIGGENLPDRERAIREKGVTMCYDSLAFDNLSGTYAQVRGRFRQI
jgi:hypothetical protein